MPYIIGLNSGSSFDGVDAVLCRISLAEDGHPTRPEYVDALTVDWPAELQEPVLKAFNNELTIFEMTRVNYAAGALFAQAVRQLLKQNGLHPEDIEVIGYDGQTVYQEPPERPLMMKMTEQNTPELANLWLKGGYPCGFFIVESGVVAALSDITTVTQFRPVDHALGGSGAPLMQYLDFIAFRKESESVLTLNIGGIANVQLVCGNDRCKMMAFDTGPGNVMIDHVVKARTGRTYDEDGKLARSGKVIEPLLKHLMSHNFFERKPPRSAWRLDFGADYADKIMRDWEGSLEDLLATFTAFTARSIEAAVRDFILPRTKISRLIASGGGTKNLFLLETIQKLMLNEHGIKVIISDDVGLPATYKEAIKFATLAFATKNGLANNIPNASGASKFAVLGKMTLAPSLAKNPGAVKKNGAIKADGTDGADGDNGVNVNGH